MKYLNYNNRHICVLYSTATCNLNCKYCYIDKSPVLKKIDAILEESYQGDYYFNFMKEMFPKEKLEKVEIWGGEPTYGFYRLIPTLKKALGYFPNLNNFMFSTNLSTETCVEDILNFIKITEDFPEKNFTFEIQLSLDGPTEINDYNRGQGTTEKFTKNFSKFIFVLGEYLKNHPQISINSWFKPTLDGTNILNLQTKESIINYYKFLENYKTTFDSYNNEHNFSFSPGIPNTACPGAHTTEEGIAFKNFCHLIVEIMKENPTKHYFKWYKDIMPFARRANKKDITLSLHDGCRTCGTGDCILGLLPNNYISGCHNGFVELLGEYKKIAAEKGDTNPELTKEFWDYSAKHNLMLFTKEEYATYEHQVACFYHKDSCFQISEFAAIIKEMAELNQIDSKYKDPGEAVKGAHFIQNTTSSCLRDNLNVTGSKYLQPLGFIRLFLNGAREEIEDYYDLFCAE